MDIDNAFVAIRRIRQANQTKQIIKPGTRSPVIFTPMRTRPRCQDPHRLFISDQNKNCIHAHRRPRCHIKTSCCKAWRFLLCRSKALRRFLNDFNIWTYPNITNIKTTSQSEPERTRAIYSYRWPVGPAAGRRGGGAAKTPTRARRDGA